MRVESNSLKTQIQIQPLIMILSDYEANIIICLQIIEEVQLEAERWWTCDLSALLNITGIHFYQKITDFQNVIPISHKNLCFLNFINKNFKTEGSNFQRPWFPLTFRCVLCTPYIHYRGLFDSDFEQMRKNTKENGYFLVTETNDGFFSFFCQ